MKRAHMFKAHEWQMKQYENASIKPASQYDAHANVASRAPGWRWNRLDFYSSVALQALASVQPIRLSKNLMSEIQFDWLKILFPLTLTNACGASFILWTRLYRLSSKVSKCVVNLGSKISAHMYRMYSGTLHYTAASLLSLLLFLILPTHQFRVLNRYNQDESRCSGYERTLSGYERMYMYVTWDQSIPQGPNKQIILQYAPRQKHWLYSSRATYMYVYIYWPHANALGNDCMGPSAINICWNICSQMFSTET